MCNNAWLSLRQDAAGRAAAANHRPRRAASHPDPTANPQIRAQIQLPRHAPPSLPLPLHLTRQTLAGSGLCQEEVSAGEEPSQRILARQPGSRPLPAQIGPGHDRVGRGPQQGPGLRAARVQELREMRRRRRAEPGFGHEPARGGGDLLQPGEIRGGGAGVGAGD